MQKIVTFGEIMLRLTPPGFLRFSQATSFDAVFAGSESNVAVSLANFGLPTEFVTRLPENDLGDCVVRELRKYNVGTSHILRGGERLGIYFLEMGAVNRGGKVLYDRANSSMATIQLCMIDWEKVFAGAGWFHWSGITPALSQNAADACLEAIQTANRLGITVSTDLNHRSKLWSYGKHPSEVMPKLVEGCDVILAAKEDAQNYFGLQPENQPANVGGVANPADVSNTHRSILKQLKQRFPRAKKVVTTLRGGISASHNSWSGMLWNGENFCEAPTYQITHIVDRVGAGDAFMGGLIYGLLTFPGDDQKALDFAVAASCLKHTIFGDVNLATVKEVELLMSGEAGGRVSR